MQNYDTEGRLNQVAADGIDGAFDYRILTTEFNETTEYLANELNQYPNILRDSASPREFIPEFDADGNQTLLRTLTGIWHASYNAENRPVLFSNDTSVIEMAYDYMGRRFEYKETVSGILARHECYLYRGYLQLAALDMLNSGSIKLAIAWDPSEPTATRPLALQTPSGWFTYAFDQIKNVTELFNASGNIAATYDYAPFGAVTESSGPAVAVNPLTFSSEITDTALGLQYYNFRHLNTLDGRWIGRDPIGERGGLLLYGFVGNDGVNKLDKLGLTNNPGDFGWDNYNAPLTKDCCGGVEYDPRSHCCRDNERISREPVSTGVKIKCSLGRRDPWFNYDWGGIIPHHCWLEFPGGATGFYPNPDKNEFLPHRGRIAWPKDGYSKFDSEHEVKISACQYDIQAFINCVSADPGGDNIPFENGKYSGFKTSDRTYMCPYSDCRDYPGDLIESCKAKAMR